MLPLDFYDNVHLLSTLDDDDVPADNAPLSDQIQTLLNAAGAQAASAGATTGAAVGGNNAISAGAAAGLQAAAGAVGLAGLGAFGNKLTNNLTIAQIVGLNSGMWHQNGCFI